MDEKQALRKYIEKADKAVTIHAYIKEEMLDLGIEREISIVNHGIDTDVFSPGGERFEIVLFPGRAEESKGTGYYKELLEKKCSACVLNRGSKDWPNCTKNKSWPKYGICLFLEEER